jgi:serine/threonine protein kinase
MAAMATPRKKVIMVKKIGEGNNATVWRAYTPKSRSYSVVKRIRTESSRVYCVYGWKAAGYARPLKRVRGASAAFVVDMADDPIDLEKTPSQCIATLECASEACHSDAATTLIKGNEFLTEVAVGACLSAYVNPFLPHAVFCKQLSAWRTKEFEHSEMEHAGTSLQDCVHLLSEEQLTSILLQVLVALEWAQTNVRFKHHDLHPGNVFVKKLVVRDKWLMPSGLEVELPDTTVQAVIADFGLSAVSDPQTLFRHCRVDYSLMNTDERAWGQWSHSLDNARGYDFVVLLSCLKQDTCKRLKSLVQSFLKATRAVFPKLRMSHRGRPLVAVDVTPEQLVAKMLPSFSQEGLAQIQEPGLGTLTNDSTNKK